MLLAIVTLLASRELAWFDCLLSVSCRMHTYRTTQHLQEIVLVTRKECNTEMLCFLLLTAGAAVEKN